MSSDTSLVFCTPELLELILLHLPLPSLLLCRQTSSTWNDLIISSPALQQKLFFCRTPSDTSKEWHANPLLRSLFLTFFAAPESRYSSRDYTVLERLDWESHEAFLRKEASWRRMALISHPPSTLRVKKWRHGQNNSNKEIAHIPFDSKSGVTMGIIYDIVHSFLLDNSGASFAVAFNQIDVPTDDQTNNNQNGQHVEVEMTLCLEWFVTCEVEEYDEDKANRLRSEGEETTAYGLNWKETHIWDEDDPDVPYMWEEWKSDLDLERGGVDEGEWEEWKSRRGI